MNIIGPSLLGFHDRSNIESLARMFDALGVEINAVLPLGATPADLRTIGRAWLNVGDRARTGAARDGVSATTFWDALCPRIAVRRGRDDPLSARGLRPLGDPARPDRRGRRAVATCCGIRARSTRTRSPANGSACSERPRLRRGSHARCTMNSTCGWSSWAPTCCRTESGCASASPTDGDVLVTSDYREVAAAIDRTRPDIVFGSQMERHSASGFGVPCAVISPPAHILNFPLSYAPFVGYDGANYLGRHRQPHASAGPGTSLDRDVRPARTGPLRRGRARTGARGRRRGARGGRRRR